MSRARAMPAASAAGAAQERVLSRDDTLDPRKNPAPRNSRRQERS